MSVRPFAALAIALLLGACQSTPEALTFQSQMGADLATICSDRLSNQAGAAQKPECDSYWRQKQIDAYRSGGATAMEAVHQQALAVGNVSRPLPGSF